jgi:hypothetical protein
MPTYRYEKPVLLAPNLWELRGTWSNAFGRRMTVVRLESGAVFVHNAMELEPAELDWLEGLGGVRAIIAPNKFHSSDAPWMAKQFPQAALFVPATLLKRFAAQGLTASDVATSFPRDVESELACFPMEGTRIAECAFVHRPSRTLLLCDLAMNMEDVFTGIQGAFMQWNKVGGRFGVTRLTKLVFSSDRRALVDSYRRLLDQDFNRVVVNHGAVLPTGGKDLLARSVNEIFGVKI